MNVERESRIRSVLNTLKTEATLRDIRRALEPEGVEFLVLKGVHLGATVYGKPEDRPHTDIDILVAPKAFSAACLYLEAAGFERAPQTPGRTASTREFYDWGFYSRHGVPVEVHRALAGYERYPVDVEALLERSEAFCYGKTEVRGLSAEDLLLHLCIHMAKSYFAHIRPKHVADIAMLLAKRPICWEVFLDRAAQARCRCGACYALRAAVEQRDAAVPPEVIERLRPSRWRRVWVESWIDPGHWPICSLHPSAVGAIQLRLALPLLDRIRDWPKVLSRFLRVRGEDWVRSPFGR